MPYMKHHETSWIIENHYEPSVTISSHYHESLFGEIWQVWHVWSSHRDYVSMSRLVFYLHDFIKKQLLCAATQRIVLGAQLLQFMQLLMLFPGSNAWCLRTQTVGPHRACRWQAAAKLHKSLVSLGAQGAQQESTRCISLCWIEPSLDAVGQRCQS